MRALAAGDGSSSLVYSSTFQQQLTGPIGLHPSGFFWLNTKGALQGLTSLFPNPAFQNLIEQRDPILVVFSATSEQIRAASRTKFSDAVMNLMLLQGLGRR